MFSDDDISDAYASDINGPGGVNVEPIILAVQSFGGLDKSQEKVRSQVGVVGRFKKGDTGIVRGPYGRMRHYGPIIEAWMADGYSVRQIAKWTGMSRITIGKFMRQRQALRRCPCGEAATHQGWCRVRFVRSEARQQFMRQWHAGRIYERVR